MKPFRLVTLATLTFGLLVTGPAVASDITVGQFVQQLAESKALDADDPRVAALSLSARLTEGDVVQIARALGLNLTSSRPESAFDRIHVDRFLKAFATELGTGSSILRGEENEDDQGAGDEEGIEEGNGPPFDPFSKGKGKGKGKQVITETAP